MINKSNQKNGLSDKVSPIFFKIHCFVLFLFLLVFVKESFGQKKVLLTLSEKDCAFSSIQSSTVITQAFKNSIPIQLVLKSSLQRDSSYLFERFKINNSYKENIIWSDSVFNLKSKNGFSFVTIEDTISNSVILSEPLKTLNMIRFVQAIQRKVSLADEYDLCAITNALPTRIKLLSGSRDLTIWNRYNDNYYIFRRDSSVDTLKMTDAIESNLYELHFGKENAHQKRLGYLTLGSEYAQNGFTNYQYNAEKKEHLVCATIYYTVQSVYSKQVTFDKKMSILRYSRDLKLQEMIPVKVNGINFSERNVIINKKNLFTKTRNPDADSTKDFYFLAQYELTGSSYEFVKVLDFQLPKIHTEFGAGYDYNLIMLESNGVLTFPFFDYAIDLSSLKKYNLNLDKKWIESMRGFRERKQQGLLPFAIWSMKRLSDKHFIFSFTLDDKMNFALYNMELEEMRVIKTVPHTFRLVPTFYITDGQLGFYYKKQPERCIQFEKVVLN